MYGGRACTLSEQCDVVGVSSELCDVASHPAQHHHLILESCIAWHLCRTQRQKPCTEIASIRVNILLVKATRVIMKINNISNTLTSP